MNNYSDCSAAERVNIFLLPLTLLSIILTNSVLADAPNVSLARHDEMIQWPAEAPWDGKHLNSEYKDAQFAYGKNGALLLYLPVTRSDDGDFQTLFRWDSADNRFESITDKLNIDMNVARDTYDADFVDIDGDGDPDIVHSSPHGNFIFVNDGDDNFTDQTSSRLPEFLRTDCLNIWDDIESGDIDGDGDIDLVFANRSKNIGAAGCSSRRPWGPSAILYNDGAGVFGRTQLLGKPDNAPSQDRESSSHSIEFGDINNDGRLDLIISRTRNYTNIDTSIYTAVQLEYHLNSGDTDGDGRINWASPVNIVTAGYSNNIELFDFDNDGDLDIFVARNGADQVHLNQFVESNGSTLFNSVPGNTLEAPDSNNYSYDISIGDINNDGLLDMAVPDVDAGATGANALYLNDGGVGFERSNDALITNANPYFRLSTAFADVDQDNKIDMIWTGDEKFNDNEPPTILINTTASAADTIAPRVENPTLLFSAGFPASANFRIRLTDSSPDLDDITASLNWVATGSMGTVVSALAPTPLTWAATSTYQARLACSMFSDFQAGEILVSFGGEIVAADGRTPANSDSVNLSDFGATTATDLANNFINSVAGELAITITEPTSISPSVAQPNDGTGRLLVRVRLASIDLQPEAENFTVTIGGQAALVITGSLVANEMWLVVQTPVRDLTSTLQVTYSPCGLTEVASMPNSVVFTDSPIDTDTMIVVDRSGSMRYNRKMESAKNAGSLWVDTLRDNEKVGVAWYAGKDPSTSLGLAEVEFDIDQAGDGSNRVDAINQIRSLTPGGGTPLGTGLSLGLEEINSVAVANRNDIRQIVLLSDGLENVAHFWSNPPDGWPMNGVVNNPVIDSFLAPAGSDVIIHTVSLGPEANHELMSNIASLHFGKHVIANLDTGGDDLGLSPHLISHAYAATPITSPKLPNRLADLYEDLHNTSTQQQRLWKAVFVVSRSSINGLAESNSKLDIVSFPMEPGLSFATISVNWDGSFEQPAVLVPQGVQASSTIQESRTSSNTVFRVSNPNAGIWGVGLPRNWAGTEVLITVSGVSQTTGILRQAVKSTVIDAGNRNVVASTILVAGTQVEMFLALVDTDPISGATVTALARSLDGEVEDFVLVDNGISPDTKANDGIYVGNFSNTAKGGVFGVEVSAQWTGTDGVARQRLFSTAVTLKERDRDNDGISDIRETLVGLDPDDPTDAGQDDDNDGLDNWKEVNFGLDPFAADSDGDGLDDGQEICLGLDPLNDDHDQVIDSDDDGMPDIWEIRFALNPNDASDAAQDLDGDGLTNLQEYKNCTGPNIKDSDDDGIIDGDEVEQGLDPNDPENRAEMSPAEISDCEECERNNNFLLWLCVFLFVLALLLLLFCLAKRRS